MQGLNEPQQSVSFSINFISYTAWINVDFWLTSEIAGVWPRGMESLRLVGDGRRYEWVIAIRALQTVDFMTARWAHLPYELMETVSNRIINEISGISRVTYDISGKPPATIEWE